VEINQGPSVGGQTLVGIPRLLSLRDNVRASGRPFHIWPFETGWSPGLLEAGPLLGEQP
jgi:hypothetical protein